MSTAQKEALNQDEVEIWAGKDKIIGPGEKQASQRVVRSLERFFKRTAS